MTVVVLFCAMLSLTFHKWEKTCSSFLYGAGLLHLRQWFPVPITFQKMTEFHSFSGWVKLHCVQACGLQEVKDLWGPSLNTGCHSFHGPSEVFGCSYECGKLSTLSYQSNSSKKKKKEFSNWKREEDLTDLRSRIWTNRYINILGLETMWFLLPVLNCAIVAESTHRQKISIWARVC
jgi:hypothetical protein